MKMTLRTLLPVLAFVLFAASCGSPESDQAPVDGGMAPDEMVASQDPRRAKLDSLNNRLIDNPNDWEALEARAKLYLSMQNLSYAAADVSAVLTADSTRPAALEIYGDLAFAQNQSRISRDTWEKCMELHPDYVPCRLKMAQLYHVVTEYEKSAKLVDRVLELDPENPEAHFLKGLVMRDALGDTLRAIEWFQKAIDLAPDYREAIDMCGVMYSDLGNPLALAYFNRLLELEPESRITMYNRGMFYLKQKDWNNALADFTTCTQWDPSDIESFFNLGYIHLQLQMYPEARDYFGQALRVQPVNHRALYGRGYAYEQLGDLPNAERDYRTALSYNPQHRGSQEGLQRITRALSGSAQ